MTKKHRFLKLARYSKAAWRFSTIFTLPLFIIFLYWSYATLERFYQFGMRYNTAPFSSSLLEIGRMEFSHLIWNIGLAVFSFNSSENIKKGGLNTIRLFIPESKLSELNSKLPYSGFKYKKGRIWIENKFQKSKIKYKGDFLTHWAYYKKSIRVKTTKKNLYKGMRVFNLVAPKLPEHLNNYLSCRLAGLMGLITPRTDIINLYVNEEYRGIHVLIEQIEELTLRRHNLIPGDIYAGELLLKDSYTGIDHRVFKHPGIWRKVSVNNKYPEDHFEPLDLLLGQLSSSSSKLLQDKLSELLDMEMWGRFSALETLMQSFHYDEAHNWRLYFDPARSVMLPVVWDPMGWHYVWRPRSNQSAQLDVLPSYLHRNLILNGDYIRSRSRALEEFFASGNDQKFLEELDEIIKKVGYTIQYDPHPVVVNYKFMWPDEIRAALLDLKKRVHKTFNDVRHGYLIKDMDVHYAQDSKKQIIKLKVSGRRPVRNLIFRYLRPVRKPSGIKLRYWRGPELIEKDLSDAVILDKGVVKINVSLLPEHQTIIFGKDPLRSHRIQIKPGYFELVMENIPPDNTLLEVRVDRGPGYLQSAERVDTLERTHFQNGFKITQVKSNKKYLLWKGLVRINGIKEIEHDLNIKAGTTIEFMPGAALIVRGRLMVNGTQAKPVRFVPAPGNKKPWGAVVLKGPGANDSRLTHCEFAGGSGLKGDLFEYSAMFSVHDVKGVKVNHCRFRSNKVVDDMVHGVYSDITFKNSIFEGAFADALDMDISNLVVENSRFSNSGNDAIDLMNSKALVMDTLLQGSGDKGISVGENSQLLVVNSRLINNQIGVESKDASVASLYNVDLERNKLALNAYKKNWRYDSGGTVFLYKSRISDNPKAVTVGKRSRISIFDTYLDQKVPNQKNIILDKTVDAKSRDQALTKNSWRFPEDPHPLPHFVSYFSRINSNIRGAAGLEN